MSSPFYGVKKLQTQKPSNNNILQTSCLNNLCVELIILIKQSAQKYYNMIIIFWLDNV